MRFEDQITRLPRPFDPERVRDVHDACPWASGPVADLLAGAGASSPYLMGLLEREGGWLEGALDAPQAAFDTLLQEVTSTATGDPGPALRLAKRRAALLIALCDLGGVWDLTQVTGALTTLADTATSCALRSAIAHEIRRGKLPGMGEEDVHDAAGLTVLAMGKMGAHELNYSSDIDLICLFDETRYHPEEYHEARSAMVRATRKMAALLGDLTGEGYVFRTDLRLRPDPAVTPVCMAMEAAERYYESLGRTWERAAYIKARPCAGDLAAGGRFLEMLRPFVWRKHLDFAAIQDAHDMRLRYRTHKGMGGALTLPGHNMKLGRGGIREIEFFTQTRQLIAGGRDADLRARGTIEGLAALASKGWVPEDLASTLGTHYRAHREIEHRIQMVNDAQTHDLPKSVDGMERLACLCGCARTELEADLTRRLEEVHELTEGFFSPESGSVSRPEDFPDSHVPARWPTYPCLRSERAAQIFRRLRPEILRRLAQAPRPDEALVAFDGFLAGLPAGVQLFSLFEANPQLVDLCVDIVATAPDLGRYLSRNAAVFDAVIGGDFFAPWPGRDALRRDLTDQLDQTEDYETCLDMTRRWCKEWHFRIGVHVLRALMETEEAARAYADLAEATLAALKPVVEAEFARKYGPAPGRGAVILGMGSLGAGRLHARSDLDLIVIYDAQGQEASEGPKSLATRSYYARLTQALITALSAPMAEGRLYEVDMRLRPSGNQGPVATSWAAFQDYQQNQAWIWEHLALTRARVIAGPASLAADVEAFRIQLLARPPARSEVLEALAKMRGRIFEAKGRGDAYEAKIGPGRMQDIELVSQAAALLSGKAVRQTARALRLANLFGAEDAEALARSYNLLWALQIGARLVSDKALDPETLGQGGCAFIARLTGAQDMQDLLQILETKTSRAALAIDQALQEG